jgi:uncharacterized protein DUF1761
MMQPHNWTALLYAAAAAWLFGGIYYGLLGKAWIAAQGKTAATLKAENAGKSTAAKTSPFIISFVAEFVMAAAVSGIMVHSGFATARQGAITGALCWLGFVLTTIVVNNAYAFRSWKLTAIDAAHWLGALVIIGAIVGALA